MHHRRPTFAAALALALALAGAGCSSGGSDQGAASTTGPVTTTTAAKPIARYADYRSVSHDDPSHWVCRPDQEDICDSNLDATVVEPDGTLTVEPFHAADDAPIDCFYVYPTISRDPGTYSDWKASDDEEGYVTLNQAARLQSQCRLFAPVYRQVTLTALGNSLSGEGGGAKPDRANPYGDVLDAFRTYLAEDNDGRGFVLIGHSQGTAMLSRLLAEEIDPNQDVREHLVGAYLAGGSIAVPEGKLVGGSLEHIPLCSKAGETGCVTTWSTFRSTAPPPPGSFFGKPRDGEGVAGCVNPAAPGGGSADLDAYFPADNKASILSSLGTTTSDSGWVDASAGKITTPFVRLPGLVSGECASRDGFHYLEATVHPSDGPRADDIPGDLTPEWGLHLVDLNLVMGNVVDDVAAQAKTYAGGD